jgi:hypothetical protein
VKATEIQAGDVYQSDGVTLYTVLGQPRGEEDAVHVAVQYADGGYGVRVFDYDADVPLVRLT